MSNILSAAKTVIPYLFICLFILIFVDIIHLRFKHAVLGTHTHVTHTHTHVTHTHTHTSHTHTHTHVTCLGCLSRTVSSWVLLVY